MADNVTLNPGSGGATVSTEDVGSLLQLCRTKLVTGAHGTDGGDVTSTNALPSTWSDNTNTAAVKAASTAPAATDPAGVVTISPNSPTCGTTASGSLTTGSGAGSTLVCQLNGAAGAGFSIVTSTSFVGTIKAQYTVDGTNWKDAGSPSVTNPAAGTIGYIDCPPGTLKVQLIVSVYTSGSCTAQINATNVPPRLNASTATLTQVSAATSNTSVLAANGARKMAIFTNTSTSTMYLAFGSTASTSAHSVEIAPNGGYFELPITRDGRVYDGAISAVWGAANGNVQVTELT